MIRLDSVSHTYGRSSSAVRALKDVSQVFPTGTFTARSPSSTRWWR